MSAALLLDRSRSRWGEGDYEAATQLAREALAAHPTWSVAALDLARMLRDLGDWDGAEQVLGRAVSADSANAALRKDLAAIRLTLGRWRAAWPDVVLGAAAGPGPRLPGLLWSGETLPGGTVLLYADGGLGDAIMCARFVPLIAQRARLLIAGPGSLGRLFATLSGLAGFVGSPPLPAFDRQLPISYLPMLFGTEPTTVPRDVPYLDADAAQVAAWRARLKNLPGLRVGLVWGGNASYTGDADRSIPLAALAPVLSVPGISFVSLQLGAAAGQAAAFPMIWNGMDMVRDLADTAALLGALDLTITVDTAVAHLAGALGRQVWLLNRFNTDWRWLLGRDDSVWYPTLRQFRQTALRDWSGPIAAVAAALRATQVCGA
jgi:Tetratricopeptide repeat